MSQKIVRQVPLTSGCNRVVGLVLILTLLVTGLTSCVVSQDRPNTATPVPATPTPKPTLPDDWTSRWLKSIPCRPPCWEGITPGETGATVAVETLKHSPLVATVRMRDYQPNLVLGIIGWDWLDGRAGGDASYSAQTSTQIIYQIRPRFPTSFRLQDALQAYGEPSHVIAKAERGPDIGSRIGYEIWIVYLPHGFVLYDGGFGKLDLSENTAFGNVFFFVPTREGLAKSVYVANNQPAWVLPWQGFKSFDFYCRDESNGKLCRGE